MLIYNLGSTRKKLMDCIKDLSDEQINMKPSADGWSIAQILYHLYQTERETSALLLDALQAKSERVEDRDLSFIADRSKKVKSEYEPSSDFFTKDDLVNRLEESRFKHLQFVFNETHERTLAEKSMHHPAFGVLNLKNVVEFIWLHEKRHINQICEIKQGLLSNTTY